MRDDPERRPPPPLTSGRRLPDFTPWIVLVALLGLMALGLYLFPMVKSYMNYQDCVGSGRVDCASR
ncbi:hypothetical protein [Lichenicoccus sp.]|uniref:hypothetical protein n=1 Tax=Lichenicoccus sp. TaxID=2781899 RepID=UPI003D123AC6